MPKPRRRQATEFRICHEKWLPLVHRMAGEVYVTPNGVLLKPGSIKAINISSLKGFY